MRRSAKASDEAAVRPISEDRFDAAELPIQFIMRLVGDQNGQQPFRPFFHIRDRELAFAFAGSGFTDGEQSAEAAIRGAVGRIDQKRREIFQIKPAADNQTDAGDLGRLMRANDARERIAVGDGERRYPKHRGGRKEFFGARYAAQKRELACDLKVGIHQNK